MRVRGARPVDGAASAGICNPVIRDTLFTFGTVEKTPGTVAAMLEGHARTLALSVHLAPDGRRRGIGRALADLAANRASVRGDGIPWVAASAANPDALASFGRSGLARVAVLPQVGWKRERRLDLHLLCRRLDLTPDTAAATR